MYESVEENPTLICSSFVMLLLHVRLCTGSQWVTHQGIHSGVKRDVNATQSVISCWETASRREGTDGEPPVCQEWRPLLGTWRKLGSMLCWSKPLTLVRVHATPWLPWTPANLCCPCVGSELRGVETTLAHVVQNLLWRTSHPRLRADVGGRVGSGGSVVTKQGGLRQTLLSSIGSKDQVARTDGLSVTSPMPGRSCRQQVTGSSTGKQAQDTEVRLCETFSPGQSLFRDSPHFFLLLSWVLVGGRGKFLTLSCFTVFKSCD